MWCSRSRSSSAPTPQSSLTIARHGLTADLGRTPEAPAVIERSLGDARCPKGYASTLAAPLSLTWWVHERPSK